MARDSEIKGRQVPSRNERQIGKVSFKGNERTTSWSLKQASTGQFIQFTYNGKRRRVLVLTASYRSSKKNSILTCVDLTMHSLGPNKLNRIFDIGAFPRLVSTTTTDSDGFRFFGINPSVELEKLVKTNSFFKKNYKTFLRKKITGVVKMWNPIFSPAMINKLNIQDEV